MTIKIVGEEQVICDCTGNTPETYQDRLLVGIVQDRNGITIQLYCPRCKASQDYIIHVDLVLDTGRTLSDT